MLHKRSGWQPADCFGGISKGKLKVRALPGIRFHPDFATMALNGLAANRQANAGAFKLAVAVEASEGDKNLLVVFRFDANAVVLHPQDALACLGFNAEMDQRPTC